MTNDNQKNLPPVIRVFLSSTFADMDKERSYFNEVLVPKISRICAERGVSFFSVDLRWGITEEDQVDGKVLPICLSEIDKCRPYFIGILGNRYGSILQTVPEKISSTIPWLVGKEGHSITELEMLYAVLEHNDEETLSNCAFYLRSDDLTEQLYGHLKSEDLNAVENLKKLKQTIEEDPDTPSSRYNSIEEFGSFVMRDILNWLDKHFPESKDVDAIRSEWYNSEILRNHAPNNELNAFLDSYIGESKKPLLIYGDGARGKTASLTAWTPQNGHKVLINCGADDKYLYWPSIAQEMLKQLTVIAEKINDSEALEKISEINSLINTHTNPDSEKNVDGKKAIFFFTDRAIEIFRSRFVQWLSEFDPKEKIIIVINDLNLLDDEKSRLLCWLPSTSAGKFKLIGTTNDEDMISNAEVIGWNTKEMPLLNKERAERFVKEYLSTFGKSFSSAQLECLITSEAAEYPGLLRFIIRFLINHGRFENLDSLIVGLSKCSDIQKIYSFIYDFLIKDYSENEQKIARTVLGLVRSSVVSLIEKECFEIAGKVCDISPIEWANICRAFEQFEIIHGDYWNVRNEETQKFIDNILSDAEKRNAEQTLGDYIMELLENNQTDGSLINSPQAERKYSKAVLFHYRNAEAWDKLESALKNNIILQNLYLGDWTTVRAYWMQLLLHTDIDMVESILDGVYKFRSNGEHYNRRIGDLLLGLLVDFEYETEFEIICERFCISKPIGTIDSGSEGVSERFFKIYEKIQELQSNEQYRRSYEFVQQLLLSDCRFDEMELCQLLFVKGNAEIRLSHYNEAIETANEYYRLALKMGFYFEMRRALSMRSNALYRLGKFDDAKRISERTVAFALNEGEIRTYLGSLNLMAMMNYQLGQYDESLAIFDALFKYWSKIGNIREVFSTILNKCNALSYKEESKEALSLAERWYGYVKNDAKLKFVSTTILGNMGFYAFECGEYEKSEKYLLMTIDISKKNGFESSLMKAYHSLINLYDKTDNLGKKIEVYNEKLELYWSRKEYDELIEDLKKVVELLLIVKHGRQADDIEKYWRKKFATIKGGSAYFESRINGDTVDSVSLDSLEEQLVIAKSEGDVDKIIQCYVNLSDALEKTNPERSVEYLLAIIDLLKNSDKRRELIRYTSLALAVLIEEGISKNDNLLKKLLEKVNDEAITRIVNLWGEAVTEDADLRSLLFEMTSYIPEYEDIVARALADLRKYAVSILSGDDLISLSGKITMSGNAYLVASKWEEVMLEDLHKNEAKLIKDYMSPEAGELIAYFEKCIAFLREFDKGNAAMLAGNIAIIFRRRGDKEKTLYYHKLSMEIFTEQDKPRDYLIEMTNLATAYSKFGDQDKAIELLREAMDKATEVGDMQQRALIADNLADFLRVRGRAEDREEIIQCFEIGEKFFRSAGYTRDLVISLRNQVLYLYDKAETDVWEPILKELTSLVRENQFNEFEQSITYFEWILTQKKGGGKAKSIDEARAGVERLLKNYPKGCRIEALESDDQSYHFRAFPNEPLGGQEELHVFYNKSSENSVRVYMAFLPNSAPTNLEKLEEYITWWNGIGEYKIKWVKDNGYLSANIILMASEWETVCANFDRILGLWLIDKTAALAIFADACDVSDLQGMKLKMINSD